MLIGEGSRVRVAVRAINGNGGTSGVAQSDGVIADVTPPVSMACSADAGQANLIRDAGFESTIEDLASVAISGGECGVPAASDTDVIQGVWLRAGDAPAVAVAEAMSWTCDVGEVVQYFAPPTAAPPVTSDIFINATEAVNDTVASNATLASNATANATTTSTTSTSPPAANTTEPPTLEPVLVSSSHTFQCRPVNIRASVEAVPGVQCVYINGTLQCGPGGAVAVTDPATNQTAHVGSDAPLPCSPTEANRFSCGIANQTSQTSLKRADIVGMTCTVVVSARSLAATSAFCSLAVTAGPASQVTMAVPRAGNGTDALQRLYSAAVACRSPHQEAPGALYAELLGVDGELLARSPPMVCPADPAEADVVTLDFTRALPAALPLLESSTSAVVLRLVAERGVMVLRSILERSSNCTVSHATFADGGLAEDAALPDVGRPWIGIQLVPEHVGIWSAGAGGRVLEGNANVAVGRNVFFLPPRAHLTQDVDVGAGQTFEFDVAVRIASAGPSRSTPAQGLRLRLGDVAHVTTVADPAGAGEAHAWHRLVYHVTTRPGASGPLRISLQTLPSHSEEVALEIGGPRLRACAALRPNSSDSDGSMDISVGAAYHSGVGPLTVTWRVTDEESGIANLMLAAGTTEGGAQLLDFISVDAAAGRAVAQGVHMAHDSHVHVQLVADNAAGLRSVFRAAPVHIDRTPADIVDIVVPVGLGGDAAGLDLAWTARDDESGVSWCQIGLGSAPGLDDLEAFSEAAGMGSHRWSTVGAPWFVDRERVFAVVRCGNGAGLVAQVAESRGVLLLLTPPSAAGAEVVILPTRGTAAAESPYVALAGAQSSRTLVQASWTGFSSVEGHLVRYLARLVGPGLDTGVVDVGLRQEARFAELDMLDGSQYRVEVVAEDVAGQRSDVASATVTVVTAGPRLTDGGALCAELVGDPASAASHLVLDWTGLFEGFGCEGDACARYFADVGRFEHGQDISRFDTSARGTGATVYTVEHRHLVRTRDLTELDTAASYFVTLTAVGASGMSTTVALTTGDAKQACGHGR